MSKHTKRMSEPLPCDEEVRQNGVRVFMASNVPPHAMERWVKMVARLSGQRVDWYYGGFAIVRAIGDLAKVKSWMVILLPILHHIQRREFDSLGLRDFRPEDWCQFD